MAELLPEFDSPPVIETAISIQFSRLLGFSTAHAGWFWKSHLKLPGNWNKIAEASRLEDQFERFGPDDMWAQLGIRVTPVGESQRIQIIRDDDERMVQVQDSRIVLNWRKQSGGYPSYESLIPDFRTANSHFDQFAQESGFARLEPNQWEVTYVNHIPRGDLWKDLRDWPRIVPGLYTPSAVNGESDAISGDWRFALGSQRGRLYVSLKLGRVENERVMVLQLTARGPISPELSSESGLALGHETIVRTFKKITS